MSVDSEAHADFVVRRAYPGGGARAVQRLLPGHSSASIWQRAQRLNVRVRPQRGDAYISALVEIFAFDKAAAAERLNLHPDTLKRALARDAARRLADPEGWKAAHRAARDAIIKKHLQEILA